MTIKKLPDFIINKLKAWEVVERPSSIVKELLENALDAKAQFIDVYVNDGGKKSIVVQDDGTWIESADMDLVLERYATSKIENYEDLIAISTYGFRGEALSAIAEVSKITIQTKTRNMPIGIQLLKKAQHLDSKKIPTSFDHGTTVIVEDLFFDTPARKKFLKSSQTEYYYLYQLFINFALVNRKVGFTLTKQDKQVFHLPPAGDLAERISAIYKKDREKKCMILDFAWEQYRLYGMLGDASLRFGSGENIKIFVNQRPVTDPVVRKAILEAYRRQLPPWEYPFAIIFLEVDPALVDVNVHPRKQEVKFLDPWSVFQLVKEEIKWLLGESKFISGDHDSTITRGTKREIPGSSQTRLQKSETKEKERNNSQWLWLGSSLLQQAVNASHDKPKNIAWTNLQYIGQLRNSYLILQDYQSIYYVDQHALAERILFEKMKTEAKKSNIKSEILLQPVTVEMTKELSLEWKIEDCKKLGFDISLFGENKIVIYAVPLMLANHMVDLEVLFQSILYQDLDNITIESFLEKVFATKACKAAIKAWEKLSAEECSQLIQDGFEFIPEMFVCQHGRPFFIKITKKDVEKLFDR